MSRKQSDRPSEDRKRRDVEADANVEDAAVADADAENSPEVFRGPALEQDGHAGARTNMDYQTPYVPPHFRPLICRSS